MEKKLIEKKLKNQVLPLDMVFEILWRLPVKVLIRFQCVCRQWFSLISDPVFQEEYHRRSHQNPHLLVIRPEFDMDRSTTSLHFSTYNSEETLVRKFVKLVPTLFPLPTRSTLILPCQELVCLCDYPTDYIFICNPSTEEIIRLPHTKGQNLCIGFGYDPSSKEFKVVRFLSYGHSEIFTLGTSNWRTARYPPHLYLRKYQTGAPFLHGALHLLPDLLLFDISQDDTIVVFLIDTEECTEISLPRYYYAMKEISPSFHRVSLQEFQGSLCLIFSLNSFLELCLLKDYEKGEWVKGYIIDCTSFDFFHWVDPLFILKNGDLLLSVAGTNGVPKLYCYNMQERTFTQKTKENCSAALFVESFFTLGQCIS